MSASEISHTLVGLSHNLAAVVEQSGGAVVAVNARTRMPLSGIHWQSGIIVTSEENLKRSEEITVTLSNGSTVPVTVLGRDSSTDVAVLKLEGVDMPRAKIGDATSLKVGHLVLALGSNEGEIRAAMGIVSMLSGAWRSMAGGNIDQFIRPDITLYPGLVGGALVDTAGNVVGMNTSGRRGTVLTIPAATVNRVVNQLLARGRIARGYLGLGMQPVRLPDQLKNTLNLAANGGVIVVNVEPDGPADQAGMLIGDVMVALDGRPLADTGDVQAVLNNSEFVGKTINVQIVRGGNLVEVAIAIGERPASGN